MKLFLLFLKNRFKAFFLINNWKGWIVNLIFFPFFFFLGFFWSEFYNQVNPGNQVITQNIILHISYVVFFFIPLLLRLTLSDTSKSFKYSSHYPGKKITVANIDLILFGFFKETSFWVLFAIIAIGINSSVSFTQGALLFALYWLGGVLLSENFLNAFTFKNILYVLSIISITFIIIYVFSSYFTIIDSLYLPIIIDALLLGLYYFFYEKYSIAHKENMLIKANIDNKYIVSELRKLFYKRSLITALLFKGILLIVVSLLLKFKLHVDYTASSSSAASFLYAFTFPIAIFTFIHNNVWGYSKELAINLIIANSSVRRFFKVYLNLLIPSLLSDFIVVFILAIVFRFLSIRLFSLYVIISAFSIIFGFIGSYVRYKNINSAMTFTSIRPNASPIINILTLTPIIGIFLNIKITLLLLVLFIGCMLCFQKKLHRWMFKILKMRMLK